MMMKISKWWIRQDKKVAQKSRQDYVVVTGKGGITYKVKRCMQSDCANHVNSNPITTNGRFCVLHSHGLSPTLDIYKQEVNWDVRYPKHD